MATGRFAHLKPGDTVLYQAPHPRRSGPRDMTVYKVGRKWIYASSNGAAAGYPQVRFTFDGAVYVDGPSQVWLSREDRDREIAGRAIIELARRRLSRGGRSAFEVVALTVEAAVDIIEVLDRHGINMPDPTTEEAS